MAAKQRSHPCLRIWVHVTLPGTVSQSQAEAGLCVVAAEPVPHRQLGVQWGRMGLQRFFALQLRSQPRSEISFHEWR